MGETERLYYERDCPSESEALILHVRNLDGRTDIVLDTTIFYPEGGGQPWDSGSIAGLPLTSVSEEGGRIFHRVEGVPGLKAGGRVHLILDTERRRDHSQQHSAQHLLSAILERKYGMHTLSFHLGASASTIDVSCPDPASPIFGAIEAEAESFIAAGRPFRLHICPPADPDAFDLRKRPPAGEDELRIVEIDGYDWVPCCGTHVASCADLRILKILSTERYKGNTRLSFVAGGRAVRELGERFSSLKTIAGLLGSSTGEASARVEGLVSGQKQRESELESLVRDRARLEVDLALSIPAEARATVRVLNFSYDDRDAGAAFETAKAGAARDVAIIVLSRSDRTVGVLVPQSIAASRSFPSLGTTLRPLLDAFQGARGGGGALSFRANFASIGDAEAFAAATASRLE